MNNNITYVGLDTHKKDHKIAISFANQTDIIESLIKNTSDEIRKFVCKIKKHPASEIRFCYEAGVCGFTLKRRIEALGCQCVVIAPSLTPIKPGEKIKTDRRDAKKLLNLFKAGLLTEVHAPDQQQESARELTRCRETAKENLKRIRHQLLKFLTRHGYIYSDGHHWTGKHINWLRNLDFDNLLLKDVFDSYLTEMQHCMQRLDSLDRDVERLAKSEEYGPIVSLCCCMYGIDILTAITIITEIFDFGRFGAPGELMSYLGLTPSENSSGQRERKGSITKTGNKRIRRLLVETSWHYRHPYKVTNKGLRKRRAGQPQWAIDLADRAGQRLRKRYWHLINHGKPPCKATVAVARELAGFLWALFKEYQLRMQTKAA
jgi:transposase